jgi:hypothetical protein
MKDMKPGQPLIFFKDPKTNADVKLCKKCVKLRETKVIEAVKKQYNTIFSKEINLDTTR